MQKPFKLSPNSVGEKYSVGDTLRCVAGCHNIFTEGRDYRVVKGVVGVGVQSNSGVLHNCTNPTTFINLSTQEASMPNVHILGDMVKVVTSTTLVGGTDDRLPNSMPISVVPRVNGKAIDLVIGAMWGDRGMCRIYKGGVKDLISRLEAIHSLMED